MTNYIDLVEKHSKPDFANPNEIRLAMKSITQSYDMLDSKDF